MDEIRHESIDRDRLGVLTGAILLALALARLLNLPSQSMLHFEIFGSPVGINFTANNVMALVVLAMSITGAETLVRSHPIARRDELPSSLIFWIVPGLLGLGLAVWLNRIDNLGEWTLALLACCLPIALVLAAEYGAVNEQQRGKWLPWLHLLMIHLTALLLFYLIYASRTRSLLSGSGILIVTFLLTWRHLWSAGAERTRVLLISGIVGMILAQLMWVLNYWRLTTLQGGLLLLLAFYLLVGLMQQIATGRFTHRIAFEYGSVALIALAAIFLFI